MKAGGGVEIMGLDAMNKVLKLLPDTVREALLKKVLNDAAAPIVAAAKAKAPSLTGELRASIHATPARAHSGAIKVQIIPGAGFFQGDKYYAGFIEYGHYLGKRSLGTNRPFIPAKPFLRPAADEQRSHAVSIVVSGISSELVGMFA